MNTPFDTLAILDGFVDALAVVQRNETVVYANRKFLQESGCAESSIRGLRLTEAWPAIKGIRDHARYLHALAAGESVRFELAFPSLPFSYEIFVQTMEEERLSIRFREIRESLAKPSDPRDDPGNKEHPYASLHSRMLAHMGNCLRAELEPAETFYQMACILGQLPDVSRATFSTVDHEKKTATIHRDYCNNVPSIAGTHLLRDAETTSQELSRGQIVVISDVRTDYRSRDYAERRFKLGYIACVAIPLMRDNVWAATLMVHSPVPRIWSPDEVELIRTAAERTWLVVENARLLQEARHANEVKDRFLAMLSHELRTPLTPVVMMLSALQSSERVDADLKKNLAMIRRNIDLETRLIDDLLDITRIANGKLELETRPVRVHELLEHVCQICRDDAAKGGIELICQYDAERDAVLGDGARLEQVFWNLIKNAIKFTPAGGTVWIMTHADERELLLVVQDTGAGIAPELLPSIFNAFEQGGKSVTQTFGGLGLGLAISKAIVDLHGGRIWAKSEGRNRGASLHVALPLTIPSAFEKDGFAPENVKADGNGHPRSLHVLLVDDNADTLGTMEMLLTIRGMQVTTATRIQEALQAASKIPFDLMISDIGLPDGSGCELVGKIQKIRSLPSIALSGYGMEVDVKRSLEAGFKAHLVKPVSFEQLEKVISEIV